MSSWFGASDPVFGLSQPHLRALTVCGISETADAYIIREKLDSQEVQVSTELRGESSLVVHHQSPKSARRQHTFDRVFRIPDSVDCTKISTTKSTDGIVEIVMHKKPEFQTE